MTWPAFVSWNFSSPIDDFEPTSRPYNDSLSTPGVAAGDLHIVTLQMWLPSGGSPTFAIGRDTGSFIDETSDWAALPAITNGSAYMRSWWRFATSAMVSAGAVSFNLDGYTPATEGGNVYLNVLRGAKAPTVAYQDAASSDLNVTPSEPSGLPILHHYFGRSAFDSTNTVNSPIIQPFGRIGHPGGFTTNNGGSTNILDDGAVPGPPFGVYTDQYGTGFFYPKNADLPENGGAYTGQITWDTQTATFNTFSGVDNDPLGPQTAVIQGLVIGSVGGFMCIV